MIDPSKTRVFAVGVGSYVVGSTWALPKAAEHALRFAVWARRRGVPRENVHLFVSKADHRRLGPKLIEARAADAAVDLHAAAFHDVWNFAHVDLTQLSGDLLYMFWSGHGSLSDDGRRALFYEDLTNRTQMSFDLNDFFARLRTSSFNRFGTQIAFVDACANRFEELGFDASAGQVKAGKGRYSHGAVRQAFFLAADAGEQVKEGAFGAAALTALESATQHSPEWPPDQDAIVNRVRPQFEKATQHPMQLVWTSSTGDEHIVECQSGELPASRSVNAAAFSRQLPVRALRRLADIALQQASLIDDGADGAAQRNALYATFQVATGRPPIPLPRSTARIEMLHIVGAALQWNQEALLVQELGRLGPAAEFEVELGRLALIQEVRSLIARLPATTLALRDEYLKTMSRLGREPTRDDAATIDAILDELYQISAADEPQRPVWEFLLRLADRFPAHHARIKDFLARKGAMVPTLKTLRQELDREQRFVLSISVSHAYTDEPAIDSIDAKLVIAGTFTAVQTFPPRRVAGWDAAGASIAAIIRESRDIVLQRHGRDEGALLIEFLMPGLFLTRAPDIALTFGPVSRKLKHLHSVVVRLRERIAQRADAINLDEWEAIAKRIDRSLPGKIQWMDRTRTQPTSDTCQGVVALTFLPSDELLDIVCDGFPFMAWLRTELPPQHWNAFEQEFEAWARERPLKLLARDIRQFHRKTENLGVDLTLFWDDPCETGHWLLGDAMGED